MLYKEREYIPRRDDQSGQALSDVCTCRKGFVIGNSSVLSGDIIWLSDIIPLSTGQAGGCVKPWEYQSLTSNTLENKPCPGAGAAVPLSADHFEWWTIHRAILNPVPTWTWDTGAFWEPRKLEELNEMLNSMARARECRRCDGCWASHAEVVLLALKDAGIIASKSGNFTLVPLNNERKCTLPKKWEVCVEFCKDRSLWELTN